VSQSTLRKTFFLSLLAVMAFSTRAVIAQTSAPKPVPPIMTPDDGGNPGGGLPDPTGGNGNGNGNSGNLLAVHWR
jgi:hypothetical protein